MFHPTGSVYASVEQLLRRNSFLPPFFMLKDCLSAMRVSLRVSKLTHPGPFATSLPAFIITPTSLDDDLTIAAAAIAAEGRVTLSRFRLQLLVWQRVAASPVAP